MNSTKQDIQDRLKTIDLRLAAAEKAIQSEQWTLAESEVYAAREDVRHAQGSAEKISN